MPSDFQTETNRVVQGFVAQITELSHRATLQMLESAFGAAGALSNGRSRKNGGSPPSDRGHGVKRTADELDKLSGDFVEFVRANPGLRIEQINKQLGSSTKDLALPIRKLIAEGTIKVKGQKRSTTYFAGEGGRKKKAKN